MLSLTGRSLGKLSSHSLASCSATVFARNATSIVTQVNVTSPSLEGNTPFVGEQRPSCMSPVYVAMSSLVPPTHNPSEHLAELDPTVFHHPIRRDILHLCVVHHLDCLRQGSANTKTRGEVRGSGRKLRPQKGSGRARLGDGGSPMLRGGGVAFGPKPRDFSTKLPRKVIQMGMRVALSARVKGQSLRIVDTLDWPHIKTKSLALRMKELGWDNKTLFVTGREQIPEALARSSGNLEFADVLSAQDLSVYDAVRWSQLVLDLEAVEYFESTLSKL